MTFIADFIACSTCFGHHYAHHQELDSIIQMVAACGIWCFGFKVVGMLWSWGLCVRFAACKPDTQPSTPHQVCCESSFFKETTFITNLFRKTELKVALRTNNTIQSLLTHKQQTPDKYSQSGVYKLTCPDCNMAYVGQSGSSFRTRFNEHRNAFRFNHHTPNFATHLIEESYSFGPIHNTTQILKCHSKGTHLNTIERFYIYAEYVNNNQLNDKHTISPNSIFEALLNTQNAINPPPPFNDGHAIPTT